MDYAKRAEWLVPIGTVATGVIVSVRCEKKGPIETEELEHFDDDDIDKAQELAQSIRSVIAAELQAAHDAGVAEASPKWTQITDNKATWPGPSKNVLLTVRGYDGGPAHVVYGFRAGSHAVDGFCHSDASRMRVLPLAWMPLPVAWRPEGGR